jgi:hypothetical protein
LLIFSSFIIILTNIIKASKFLQGKDEKKPAFGQNKVRADIFSGSLAVFQSEKVAFRGAGGRGVWGGMPPAPRVLSVLGEIGSNFFEQTPPIGILGGI